MIDLVSILAFSWDHIKATSRKFRVYSHLMAGVLRVLRILQNMQARHQDFDGIVALIFVQQIAAKANWLLQWAEWVQALYLL
jgi:hypothetical protein